MMPIETDFQLIHLDAKETQEALRWTPVQRAFLQNLLGEAAHAKINLEIDPNNFYSFVQQEAFQAAKIALLRFLLQPQNQTSE